jgi:hypothetical protein
MTSLQHGRANSIGRFLDKPKFIPSSRHFEGPTEVIEFDTIVIKPDLDEYGFRRLKATLGWTSIVGHVRPGRPFYVQSGSLTREQYAALVEWATVTTCQASAA